MTVAAWKPSSRSWSRHETLPKLLIFMLAVFLPILSSVCNAHSRTLQTIPFGLYFISIAVMAILGGIWPALVAVVACAVSRAMLVTPGQPLITFDRAGFFRIFMLLSDAFVISIIDRGRRASAAGQQGALESLQERTAALVESLHSSKCASWYHDFTRGEGARWYSGSYQVFGRPFDEIDDRDTMASFLHPEDRERLGIITQRMRTTDDPVVWDYRVIWPNGDTHWLEMRATRVPGPKVVWRGVTVDITERKQAEAALLRSEKLAAMGRLASTVAHEINNPLESVTNLLYLARTDPSLSQDTRTYLATAEQELARLGDITRLTLGFVRTSAARLSVDVAVIAEEVLSIFRRRLETRSITIERHVQPGVEVHIAAHELRQILTNLISNASDALTQPGARIALHISADASGATLLVEDNGSGIPAADLQRIFDPFYTTKEDIGTGIGLWVTRELVQRGGGRISAESGSLANGMKTRFHLHFPPPA